MFTNRRWSGAGDSITLLRLSLLCSGQEQEQEEQEIVEAAERLRRLERLEARQLSWDTYTKCDPRPDASSEKALNTFLSEGIDEEARENWVSDLENAMERCVYTESIAADLLKDTGEALENGDVSRRARNRTFLHQLRSLSSAKIDFATAHLLSHWDTFSGGNEDIDRTCTKAGGIRFGVWVNTTLKGFRMKTVDFARVGMITDIPRSLSGASVAVRNIFFPYHFVRNTQQRGGEVVGAGEDGRKTSAAGLLSIDEAPQEDEKVVLGGTFLLEILALPPRTKTIKGWVFRAETELSKTVAFHTYPLDGGNAALAPLLRVQFEIPPDVIIPPTPEVRAWDQRLVSWTSEGIHESEWQPAKRAVRVHTTRVGAIAIVLDRACDVPYASWRLTPIYDPDPLTACVEGVDDGEIIPAEPMSEADLELETPRFVVRVRIRETKCRLLGPELPELKPLLDASWMGAGRLIMEMERAGICLSPRDGDTERATLSGEAEVVVSEKDRCGGEAETDGQTNSSGLACKSRILEETLCREVAKVAAAFEIRSSKWNEGLGADQAVFEIRETGAYTGGEANLIDFKTALVELDEVSDSARNAPGVGNPPRPFKCSLVKGEDEMGASPDTKKRLDTGTLQGEKTHTYLIQCLTTSSSPEAIKRTRQTSCRFQKTVEQLLRITRPFSFSLISW
ncbi:unnamed protein product [Ascophyllum nodosum]